MEGAGFWISKQLKIPLPSKEKGTIPPIAETLMINKVAHFKKGTAQNRVKYPCDPNQKQRMSFLKKTQNKDPAALKMKKGAEGRQGRKKFLED